MKRTKRMLMALSLAGAIALTPAAVAAGSATVAYAHGHHGGTHHSGYTTSYYYCGGHSAHTHYNGVCPYANSTATTSYYYCGGHSAHEHHNGACPYAAYTNQSTVKSVQRALNSCGYKCGTADGVYGTKTKKAIKRFQRDNDLTVDGVIGKKTLKALGLA